MRAGFAAALAMAAPFLSGMPALDTGRHRDRPPWTQHDDDRLDRADAKRERKAAKRLREARALTGGAS